MQQPFTLVLRLRKVPYRQDGFTIDINKLEDIKQFYYKSSLVYYLGDNGIVSSHIVNVNLNYVFNITANIKYRFYFDLYVVHHEQNTPITLEINPSEGSNIFSHSNLTLYDFFIISV